MALNAGHPATMRLPRPTPPRQPLPLQRPVPPRQPLPLERAARRRQEQQSFLPSAALGLKLAASLLAGATITLLLWPSDRTFVAPNSIDSDRFAAAFVAFDRESAVYRRAPDRSQRPARDSEGETVSLEDALAAPSNFPRRVQTVRFTPPAHQPGPQSPANALVGKPLRYLIGAESSGPGRDDGVTVVSYDAEPVKRGISVAYGNLFDERNTGRYGPYLHSSDTAAQYNEGQIDPKGPGWEKNLREQFERRRKQGFSYIELDNPDAYSVKDVIGAIELAASYGLKVIAKNPLLVNDGAATYVAHPNVYGAIVERGAGTPDQMEALRKKAGKPTLPVWFVSFGKGRGWAGSVADSAKRYRSMGVTYSSAGEYGNAVDILPPAGSQRAAAE
jgi:hypothetical protein